MKIISWNINGLRAAVKKGLMERLFKMDADIVLLQEIKAKPYQLTKAQSDFGEYKAIYNSAFRKGYSGTMVLSRVDIQEVYLDLGQLEYDDEGRCLAIVLDDLIIYNCYYPNGGRGDEFVQKKIGFYQNVSKKAMDWAGKGYRVILTGDFNTAYSEMDLARAKENKNNTGFLPIEREALEDCFYNNGFIDIYRSLYPDKVEYTWWDQKTRARERGIGWRIDYFLLNLDKFNKYQLDSYILADDYYAISDHSPVALEIH